MMHVCLYRDKYKCPFYRVPEWSSIITHNACICRDISLRVSVFEDTIKGTHFFVYKVSQEEKSIFWEVIVSVILSKSVYMNMCPTPNGFRDRTIWMYNRKIVEKEILRVSTVSNTGIYCSSDRVGTVYNKCSKIPPSTSMQFATRVKTWRIVRLSTSWRSFMQAITSSMLTGSSSRVSTFFLYTSLFIKPHKQKSNGVVSWDTLYSSVTACHQTGKHASNQPTNQPINTTPQYLTRTALSRETESSSLRRAFRLRSDSAVQRLL